MIGFLDDRNSNVGTTRDVLETRIEIKGYPVIINDTAGLNPTTVDPIEMEGIRRAYRVMQESHIPLALIDLEPQFHQHFLLLHEGKTKKNEEEDKSSIFTMLWSQHEETLKAVLTYPDQTIIVVNKVDLLDPQLLCHVQLHPQYFTPPQHSQIPVCFVSCHTGYGLDQLIHVLEQQIVKLYVFGTFIIRKFIVR
jgi:tRNA modification GTPase